MWAILNDLLDSGQKTIVSLYNALLELPNIAQQTYDTVADSEIIKNVFQRSFIINVKRYAVPMLLLEWVAKPVTVEFISKQFELDDESKASLEATIDYSVFLAIYSQLYLRMYIDNLLITLAGTVEINSAIGHAEEVDVIYELDKPDVDQKQITIDTGNLLAHYLIGLAAVKLTKQGLYLLPVIGTPLAELLEAYWQGIVFSEYAMDAKGILPGEQIAMLTSTENRARCMTLGGVYTVMLMASKAGLPGPLATAINNMAGLAIVVMVHKTPWNTDLERFKHREADGWELLDKTMDRVSIDPVIISWQLTTQLTDTLITHRRLIKKRIKAMLDSDAPPSPLFIALKQQALKLIELVAWAKEQPALIMLLHLFQKFFFPEEWQSTQAFVQHDMVKPYATIAHAQAEMALNAMKEMTAHPAFAAIRASLRAPYLGKLIVFCGVQLCEELDVPKDIFKLFVKFIVNVDLAWLMEKLEKIIADHEPEPDVCFLTGSFNIQEEYVDQTRASATVEEDEVTAAQGVTDLHSVAIYDEYFVATENAAEDEDEGCEQNPFDPSYKGAVSSKAAAIAKVGVFARGDATDCMAAAAAAAAVGGEDKQSLLPWQILFR